MVTKLTIPVVNTETNNYDFNEPMDNIQMHINVRKDIEDVDIKYDYIDCEALILDSNKKDVSEEYIDNLVNKNKMAILIININPTNLDSDACSEIKSWIEESNLILSTPHWDDKTKIKALPTMTMLLTEKKYKLVNCKMFENYSDNRKYPLYFAVLIEKIID